MMGKGGARYVCTLLPRAIRAAIAWVIDQSDYTMLPSNVGVIVIGNCN